MKSNVQIINPPIGEYQKYIFETILYLREDISKLKKQIQEQTLSLEIHRIKFSLSTKLSPILINLFLLLNIKRKLRKSKRKIESLLKQKIALKCHIFKLQSNSRDLRIAIKEENYSEAVRLRDLINLKTTT